MNRKLTIGWLYPDLMSTYGDRGNIIVLKKRCEWRGISMNILPIDHKTDDQQIKSIDLIFGGGSQDREQEIVMQDLKGKKKSIIKNLIDNEIPALFVCGAPQIMGKYYEPAIGKRIEGLGIFDMVSINPGPDSPRCIVNIVASVNWKYLDLTHNSELITQNSLVVGFENHGGRTYLSKNVKPFAYVIKGYGNNGKDKTEGVVYKNAIGSYLHGPLLPKNPQLADFLIKRALEVKYKEEISLKQLNDTIEINARKTIVKKLKIRI